MYRQILHIFRIFSCSVCFLTWGSKHYPGMYDISMCCMEVHLSRENEKTDKNLCLIKLIIIMVYQNYEIVSQINCDLIFDLIISHASSMAIWITMLVGQSVHHFGLDWNISTTIQYTGWIASKLCTNIFGPQKIRTTDFSDPWPPL